MSVAIDEIQTEGTIRKAKKKRKSFLSALLHYKAVLSKPKYLFDMVENKRRQDGTNLSRKQEDSSLTTCRDTFIRLPVEVLIEIISHLLPVDLITLSRSSHYFRDWLMSRSSRYIWASAIKNIEDLPPCPPDMSEPYYSALLFLPCCTMCGESKDCKLYSKFRLRLCMTCRSNHLMTIRQYPGDDSSFPHELDDLVHIEAEFTQWGCLGTSVGLAVVKEEADDIRLRFEELHQSGDQVALNAWKEKRAAVVQERQQQTYAINSFLANRAYSQSVNPPRGCGSYSGDRH